MQRVLLLSILLMVGCRSVVGPFQRTPERVDDPSLPIAEQQRRGRDRLALPDSDSKVNILPRLTPGESETPGPNSR
jgi:hypothetical protein